MRLSRSTRLQLAIGVHSAAIIAYQLVLIRILSAEQWYHFAYMVISVALLGFGASGTAIALFKDRLLRRFRRTVAFSMLASGVAMAVAVPVSKLRWIRFDSYLVFSDAGHAAALALTYIVFTIPFFLAALAIGLSFVRHTNRIGGLYFGNLVGSGVGGLVALGALGVMGLEQLPAVIGLLPIAAAFLVVPGPRDRSARIVSATVSAVVCLILIVKPAELRPSEFKDLKRTMLLPGARVVAERQSPEGTVEAVSVESGRSAPGLSLSFEGELRPRPHLFLDGDAIGSVWTPADRELEFMTAALPYAVRAPATVLVLGLGSTEAAARALASGARRVTAVESRRPVLEVLRVDLASVSDSLVFDRRLNIVKLEPRTYLSATGAQYDLIVPPVVGAFGGTSGLTALAEDHILTTEGVSAAWARLAPGGLLAITSWLDYPYRRPLRIATTAVAALKESGVEDVRKHLAVVRGWGTATFLITRSPLDAGSRDSIRAFCERMSFDPVVLPGIQDEERARFNQGDEDLLDLLDRAIQTDPKELIESYAFRVGPVHDDRPFFSQFLRWKTIGRVAQYTGEWGLPYLELGYLIVLLTLIQVVVVAVLLILVPLIRIGWQRGGRSWTTTYFGGLGLGYMFVEIVMIHRFSVYVGDPVRAAATAITVLLIGSGLGSLLSSRIRVRRETLAASAAVVSVMLAASALVVPLVTTGTIGWPVWAKVAVGSGLLAPVAFCMGFPFPLGLRFIEVRGASYTAWAWGINGCVSVVSTVLATICAVEFGLTAVMIGASLAYLLVVAASLAQPSRVSRAA